MNPIDAINQVAEALMIDTEKPQLRDRITRQDVCRVLRAKGEFGSGKPEKK